MAGISNMKKADLVEAIRALGEEPPSKWTNTELRVRLLELEEEQGITRTKGKIRTSHQGWMVELNKHSKKKADLIQFCQSKLQLPLEGTETMPQLEKKAVEKIYAISEPSGKDPMGFGMHSQLSYQEVMDEHPSYGEWAHQTAMEGSCHPRLSRFAHWYVAQRDVRQEPQLPVKTRLTPLPEKASTKNQVIQFSLRAKRRHQPQNPRPAPRRRW